MLKPFISILSVVICFSVFAQTGDTESRIKIIKSLYYKSQNYINSNPKYKVVTGKLNTIKHTIKSFTLPENLTVVSGQFSGWEFDESISFYKKDGGLYFVFITNYDVQGKTELRIYFDTDENIIKILEKSDRENGILSDNIPVTDPTRINTINSYINEKRRECNSLLN